MSFSSGLAAGYQLGSGLVDAYGEGQLRKRMDEVDKWQVEEIPAGGLTPQDAPTPPKRRNGSLDIYLGEPQTPDTPAPDAGLAPPAQTPSEPQKVVGYRFGGQIFTTKPPKELQDAIRTEQRAIIHGQLGDADKAELYHQAAITQREKAINNIAERAFSSGSLPAIFNALSTIDDGLDYRYEVGKNGVINVFTNPDGSPDKSTLAKTFANENEALAFARSSLNPKLVSDLATAEQSRAYQRSMMDYNQANLGLHQQQQADQSNYRQLQELDRKYQYFSNMAGKEPDLQRKAYFLEEADKIQAQMAGIGGQQSGAGGVQQYEGLVRKYAEQSGVPYELGMAVLKAESGGNPNALSPKGAGGLMQLMPGTAKEMGVTNVNDPEQNIRGGMGYLAKKLAEFNGNVPLAVAAYNAGSGAVRQAGNQIPNYAETKAYVPRVLSIYKGLGGAGDTGDVPLSSPMPNKATGLVNAPAPRQYTPDNPYYKQAEAMGLAQQEQMRMKSQKPVSLDDWLKLQTAAESMAQMTKGYADMSPEGQAQLRQAKVDELFGGYQAAQGGLSGAGAAAPRPSLLDGAKALQEKANGDTSNTPPPLPKTGTEAAAFAKEQASKASSAAAAKKEPDEQTKTGQSEALHNFYLIAKVQTKLARSNESPERKKAIAQDAIDKVTTLYDSLSDGNKPMAVELLTKLYPYVN